MIYQNEYMSANVEQGDLVVRVPLKAQLIKFVTPALDQVKAKVKSFLPGTFEDAKLDAAEAKILELLNNL